MRHLRPKRTYWLGTHQVNWLRESGLPLFISYRRIARYRSLPLASAPWCIDSGGFTELGMHGRWCVDERDYAADVQRYQREVGSLAWATPMDWMCEPHILKRTGLSVREHQHLTVRSYLQLRDLAPGVSWTPVLQGWTQDDYLRCWHLYDLHGVDLGRSPIVGVGTICKRQGTLEVAKLLRRLAGDGLRLHGFGLKLTALQQIGPLLASADSLAWSYDARRKPPLAGHTHKNCANCIDWARAWRLRALEAFHGRAA